GDDVTAPYDVEEEERGDAFHVLLLRLAGKVPDDLIVKARSWLAEGQEGEAARAVTFAVTAQYIPLVDADVALLDEVLRAEGYDPSVLSQVQLAEFDPAPPFRFGPTAPGVEAPVRADDAPLDEIDRQAIDAVSQE